MNNLDETGPYIWLRYATQYTKDGRSHTLEMSIPIPIGADAGTREQLIREAEAGMNQLGQHMGKQSGLSVEGASPSATPPRPQQAQISASPVSSARTPTDTQIPEQSGVFQSQPPQRSTAPAARSASIPAPQTAVQSSTQVRPTPPSVREAEVPPTRPNIGASMPMSMGPGLTSVNLTIPEFIRYIDENLHLTPKRAMELLKVKSLAGLNLRDALERLHYVVSQEAPDASDTPASSTSPASLDGEGQRHEVRERGGAIQTTKETSVPAATLSPSSTSPDASPPVAYNDRIEHENAEAPRNEPEPIDLQSRASIRSFDEEIEPDENDLDDFEDLEPLPAFTPQQLQRARTRLSELRESQGATVASPNRLKVLSTVAASQIGDEQLVELAAGIWSIPSLKKLKVDQVEALISWAKLEDDFVEQVEALLAVIEEERYARGNR